jgi:type II pantothenate kinase
MGNQLALDIGPAYVRATAFLEGVEDLSLELVCSYSALHCGTFYFFQYRPNEVTAFKSHALYGRLQQSSAPVYCAGIKHDATLQLIKTTYNIEIQRQYTTSSNIKALEFLASNRPQSFFSFVPNGEVQLKKVGKLKFPTARVIEGLSKPLLPCLLVNLRSGISVYKVTTKHEYTRVGGSSIGGSTFWALMKLMTDYTDPAQAISEAVEGDTTDVDMSVGDIYGGDYPSIGLSGSMLASSCAKMRNKRPQEMNRKDISKSLLTLFAFNVSQITYLLSQVEALDTIIIAGNLVNAPEFMQMAQDCMNFWSQGTISLIFNHHASYLGSWGSLLERPEFAS